MYKIKIFFEKIIKIFQYIPILWEDEDYDYSYITYLLKYKLTRMKKCIKKNDIIVQEDIIKIENQINKVIDAINKCSDSYEYFPLMHPQDFYDVEIFWKENEDKETYSMCHRFITSKDEVPEEHEYHKYSNRYHKRLFQWEQACWNRIWNEIRDNSQFWWD